jgi:hypothetical protein
MVDLFRFLRKKEAKPAQFRDNSQELKAKEDFVNAQDWLRALVSGGVGGIKSKFISDVYKTRILYPHEEMLAARKISRYNSYTTSAVNKRARLLTGGKVTVVSDDEETQNWCNKIIVDTNLGSCVSNDMSPDLVITGNGYSERIRDEQKRIIFYDYQATPERMYIDIDDKGFVKAYLQETPEKISGQDYGTIRYYGDNRKTIKGKLIDKDKIFHLRLGRSEIPIYGRGLACSAINDFEILLEIERALAVIARYKAVPKKLIMLNRGDELNGGKAAETYANQISSLSDTDNPVIPEVAQVADLSYNGKDISFDNILTYFTKKLTIAIAPSFIMQGDANTYSASDGQMEVFILEVQGEREQVANSLKKELRLIAKSHGKVLKDFEVKFGDLDLGQTKAKMDRAKELYVSNIITLNEAREIIGLPEDDENGTFYSNELGAQSSLFGASSPVEDQTLFPEIPAKDAEEKLKKQVAVK